PGKELPSVRVAGELEVKSKLLRFAPVIGTMSQEDLELAVFCRLSGTLLIGPVACHEVPASRVSDAGQQDLRILHADDPILVEQWNEPQRSYFLEPALDAPVVLVVAGDVVASQTCFQICQRREIRLEDRGRTVGEVAGDGDEIWPQRVGLSHDFIHVSPLYGG